MGQSSAKRTVFFIWLGWVVAILGFQTFVTARFDVRRPDYAVFWTAESTRAGGPQDRKFYLQEPFMRNQSAWDSEYYLAIAIGGYEDPNVDRVGDTIESSGTPTYWPFVAQGTSTTVRPGLPLSYAFFPFYPLMIRLLAWPLTLLGLNAIATATLAGVIVSTLGTLAAMLALYELAKDELGESGGIRAAFYLLIFPSGFFLAQVYTEGLFVGLAFSSLALLRKERYGWAALLAVLATFTRAAGVLLVVPLLLSWLRKGEWLDLDIEWRQVYFNGLPWKSIGRALIILAPAIAFGLWKMSDLGRAFTRVEEEFFGRGFLSLGYTYTSWTEAFDLLFGSNLQSAAYYFVEFLGIVLGFTACIVGLKRHPDVAWFGLLVVLISFTSGPAQGMYRYVIAAPPVFLFLSRLGKNPAFDRVWTLASTLIMAVMAIMFTFDLWAG
jgi:hypothetical protein